MHAAARLCIGVLVLAAASCQDVGVVGSNGCPKACRSGQICHPTLSMCVQCAAAKDCAATVDKPFCDTHAFTCVQCRDARDCSPSAPVCMQGACVHQTDDHGTAGDDSSGSDDRGVAGTDDRR